MQIYTHIVDEKLKEALKSFQQAVAVCQREKRTANQGTGRLQFYSRAGLLTADARHYSVVSLVRLVLCMSAVNRRCQNIRTRARWSAAGERPLPVNRCRLGGGKRRHLLNMRLAIRIDDLRLARVGVCGTDILDNGADGDRARSVEGSLHARARTVSG